MGLDMYLKGKRYLSKYFNEGDTEIKQRVADQFPELKGRTGRWGDDSPVQEVQIEAGYWRKSNQIHNWFVKNVQGGEDECRPHYVSREQLKELRDVCQEVIDNHKLAPQLLPTASGFFFGGTDYDDWYYDDLKHTIQICDEALALPEAWEFEYQSSW